MKVLIVGPYAPHGQVGAIRIISFSKYLVGQGHEVTVLCLSENTLNRMDAKALCARIPEGVKVVTYDITLDAKSILVRNWLNARECSGALKTVLRAESYDVVVVSGGPFYSFSAMKEVRKKKIPYVVDYRDLHLSSADKRKRNGVISKIKFWLTFPARYHQEISCTRPANHITVVAPEMKENLCDYFHLDESKISVVYNGYDDVEIKDLQPLKPLDEIFTVGYFGKLMYYNQEYTKMMFRVLEKINKDGIKIRFLHIGPPNPLIQEYFEQNKMNNNQWYKCAGQMNYRQGMELLASCNACVLEYAYPEGPGTKIFDYICLNKPVIGITRPGISLEKMLQKFENSYVCHKEEDIEYALQNITKFNISTLVEGENAKEIIGNFARSKQNAIWEEILCKVNGGI